MDQPRSRREVEHRPLIIERPDLAHPVRRLMAVVFTLLAWALWIRLWWPVLHATAAQLGWVPAMSAPSTNHTLVALRLLLDVFPLAIAGLLVVLAVNGLISLIYNRFKRPAAHRFVGMDRLATGMALDPDKLAAWQSAKVLHVEHGPLGRVIDARINR